MVNAILWGIAEYCTSHNLGFMQTLEFEHEQCAQWGIPYNRHVKRRLDAIKRQIMNEWER